VGASGDFGPPGSSGFGPAGGRRCPVPGAKKAGEESHGEGRNFSLTLKAKEGLSLINGTQVMTAVGLLALLRAERLCKVADIVGACTLDALKGTFSAFDPDIQRVRASPGN